MAKKMKKYQSAGEVREAAAAKKFAIADSISKAKLKAMLADTVRVTSDQVNKGPVQIKGKSGTVTMKPAIATKKSGGQTKSKKK